MNITINISPVRGNAMADTTISVTLKGSAITGGTIELRRLVQFGDRLQKAVDRMAYSIEKKSGSRQKLSEVRKDTSLRLVNTKEGSFVAELNFIRPPILFEDYYDIATESMTKLISGLESLRTSEHSSLPDGYDQGVLLVLKELGRVLNHGIDSMEFDVKTPSKHIMSTYDSYTHSRVIETISEPEEKIAAVTGTLLMVNFRKERYRCHLFLDSDNYISCTFDEDVADDIERAMRNTVHAIGVATINPVNDEIAQFHIKQIAVLDENNLSPQQLSDLLDAYIKDNDTIDSFRKSWEEALSGEARPISELWEGIDAE